jgi:arabinofuranan 3-O-arabinosyltransferase
VTITLDEPAAIEGLRLQTRQDWAKKAAPAVVVDIDGQEVTRRLPEHGVLTLPSTKGRRITLSFVSVPGRGRPGLGGLELEEVEIVGSTFDLPVQELRGDCGSGPRVTMDGRAVPTSAAGPRSALFGLGEFTWQACGTVSAEGSDTTKITVDPWHDLAPDSVVLTPLEGRAQPEVDEVPHVRIGAGVVHAQIPAGDQRLVVMRDNSNPGWQATLGGSRLESQVVDGRRQGFVVPAGASGQLTIAFAPDRWFRWGLAAGALLAAAVVSLALWPDRARRRQPGPRVSSHRAGVAPGAVVGWCAVLAGPMGLAVGAASFGAGLFLQRSPRVRAGVVLGLGLAAALIQAWMAPGVVGGSVLEGGVRLLVLAAFATALSTQDAPDEG